jgi:transposase-like protein
MIQYRLDLKGLVLMLRASIIQTVLRPPLGTHRPPDEKIAALTTTSSVPTPEFAVGIPKQELYVGEIRDAVMPHGLLCPRCGSRQIVRFGKRGGTQRYRCKACARTFTDFTGTILHGLRRRDLWLDFCRCLMEGLSVRETAAELGISKNTSFAWRHRAISALASADSTDMCRGIVELGQWPLLLSFKGSRVPDNALMDGIRPSIRRHHRVYGHLIPRSRQITMLVAVDRTGRVRAEVAPRGENMTPTLARIVMSSAELCAPRWGSRFRFGAGWPGGVHWVGPYGEWRGRAGGPLYHVRNANRLIHYFAEWMRRFCGVATKYLLRYFAWYLRWTALAAMSFRVAAKLLFLEVLGSGPGLLREAS